MRVGITGSWREDDQDTWGLLSDFDTFKEACAQIGKALAESGVSITVGSESILTADRYVVEGYLSSYTDGLSVTVIRPKKSDKPFAKLYKEYPQAFTYDTGDTPSWRFTRQKLVSDIDVLVTIGGAEGTYQAGLELALTRKRLVPIGAFGGASERLLTGFLHVSTARDRKLYRKLDSPWDPHLVQVVMEILGANRPSRVLLIHGHAKDRLHLQNWLQHEKLTDSVIMGQKFSAGQTLPEKFERLANEVDAAIALATPDDLASTASCSDVTRTRARQNVWVEVGWFWGRLGLKRVLLLVRGNVEIPSDLDGIEHLRYKRSVREVESKIRDFLHQVSEWNQ